jgi:glycine/D-amino acid oxidase-like deaminating enzyme
MRDLIIIVGGGIAGSALALAISGTGANLLQVTVRNILSPWCSKSSPLAQTQTVRI